jgi:hypothetical protein
MKIPSLSRNPIYLLPFYCPILLALSLFFRRKISGTSKKVNARKTLKSIAGEKRKILNVIWCFSARFSFGSALSLFSAPFGFSFFIYFCECKESFSS